MLWFILYIASLVTALASAAKAEEGVASQYGRDSGDRVPRERGREQQAASCA